MLTGARRNRRGGILDGSLTLDDYLPGHSDVDMLVVVHDPLTDAQLAALTEALAGHGPRARGPVDLRVVTRQVAASPTPAPPMEVYLRLTPTSGVRVEERRHPGNAPMALASRWIPVWSRRARWWLAMRRTRPPAAGPGCRPHRATATP